MFQARTPVLRALATALAGVLLSSSVEMTQLFEPGRVCSLFDVCTNLAGTAAGIAVAATFPRPITGAVSSVEAAGLLRVSGVVALLYLFAGYQLFPFFPALSRTLLRAKLAILFGDGLWIARDFFEALAAWLAASALLESLIGGEAILWIAPLALGCVPLKLLIAGRTMTGSELAGALVGIGCWILSRRLPRRNLAAALLVVAALVAAGLTPFHLAGSPQPFTWTPFLALLETPWIRAFQILLQKSFLYGAAVWLLRNSGCRWLPSMLLVAIALAGVEATQVYLPGRTPESTDPLLAVLMGLGLMLMERHADRARA